MLNGKCFNPECESHITNTAQKLANIVVNSSTDEEEWFPVKPEDVPGFCKDTETMGMMVKGYACKRPDDECWYIAEKVDE